MGCGYEFVGGTEGGGGVGTEVERWRGSGRGGHCGYKDVCGRVLRFRRLALGGAGEGKERQERKEHFWGRIILGERADVG